MKNAALAAIQKTMCALSGAFMTLVDLFSSQVLEKNYMCMLKSGLETRLLGI